MCGFWRLERSLQAFHQNNRPGWSEGVQAACYFRKLYVPECRKPQAIASFGCGGECAITSVLRSRFRLCSGSGSMSSAATGTEDERRNASRATVDSAAEAVGPAPRHIGRAYAMLPHVIRSLTVARDNR